MTTTEEARTPGQELREILLRAKWIGQRTTAEDYSARVVFDTQEEAYDAYRALVAVRDATPAPSSPGVPDSVRVLPPHFRKALDELLALTPADWGMLREFDPALVARFEKAISTHPAGQSTGQGAEDTGLKDAISEIVRRAEKDQAFLRRTLARMRSEPAPDSTRTGQVETDGPSFGDGRRICEALGFDPANHHNALKCPYCNPEGLTLAARPAAPEALVEALSAARLSDRIAKAHADRATAAEAALATATAEAASLRAELAQLWEDHKALSGIDQRAAAYCRERDAALAEVEALKGALKPFAEAAPCYDPPEQDDGHSLWAADGLRVGHLRAARTALARAATAGEGRSDG